MTASISSSLQNLRTVQKPEAEDEKIQFLKKYDFLVLLDKSGSMSKEDDGETRWNIVKEELKHIVSAAVDLDPDGIDVCFFGSDTEWHDGVESEDAVDRLFSRVKPGGVTKMGEALHEAFQKHFSMRRAKRKNHLAQKTIVLVVTDGVPHDGNSSTQSKQKVADEIVAATHKLSHKHLFRMQDRKTGDWVKKTTEIGLRFFQVGNSRGAKDYLEKLDDDLEGADVDIVDTGDIEELNSKSSVLNAFLDAIFD